MKKLILVTKEYTGCRLDTFVARNFSYLSRSGVKKLIESGNILVDNKKKKASSHLQENEEVEVAIQRDEGPVLKPYPLVVDILYEDEYIILINKSENLTVHPPNKNSQNTLINALLYMGKELSLSGGLRRGIVHRLDKETSGVMVVAKNDEARQNLISQFKERKIKKEYRAIVWGVIEKDELGINLPLKRDERNRLKMRVSMIEAKNAVTRIKVINRFNDSTYIKAFIMTGRMHQIRVHMSFLGYPIAGDKKYGRKDGFNSLFLHSFRLGFYHPHSGRYMEFESPFPERFTLWMHSKQSILKGSSEK